LKTIDGVHFNEYLGMKKWFKSIVPGGHVGAGRTEERTIYLYAEDIIKAQKILMARTGGWKKDKGFLELKMLKDVSVVDKVLSGRGKVSKEQAMADGFLYAEER
jgi:hypothetical protein